MTSYRNSPYRIQQSAEKIALGGRPVFPCGADDKRPHTRRGFKDATTSPSKITAFWTRYPDARIGMPTGKLSGVFVVDVDRLEALGELPQELPDTRTIRTPSGGLHYYFNHVDGLTNRTGALPDGIDIRAEGGYVLVPPSEGYSVEHRAPIADAPDWLLDLLREKPAQEPTRPGASAKVDIETGSIPQGGRNNTLTSIAGRLRACGFKRSGIEDALLRINAERCTPPLEEPEVRKIAASVARYSPGKAGPDAETLSALEDIEEHFWRSEFPGMGGKSERSVVAVLIKAGRGHGRLVPGGVEISIDHRTLALAAATSRRTVGKVLKRSQWLGRGQTGSGTKSGTIVLRGCAKVPHSYHQEGIEQKNSSSGESLRGPRLRWSAPGIRRLGKSCEAAVDYLDRAGGTMPIEELAAAVGAARISDFRRRVVSRLKAAHVVECSGNVVSLVTDWLEALNEEREHAGEIAAFRRDMARYNRQREAFRTRHKVKPTRHWTNKREADGVVEDLRRADEPEPEKPQPYKEPPRPPEDDVVLQTHEVDRLVRHGMKRSFALQEVLGCVELRRGETSPLQEAVEARGDWRKHPLACECEECLYPEPQYARPYEGAAV